MLIVWYSRCCKKKKRKRKIFANLIYTLYTCFSMCAVGIVGVRMTEEGCLPLPSPYPFDAFREGRKRGESVRPFKFLVQAPSRWCNLPPWLIPSPFFLSTPPLPFSFLFFRHIGAIYGLVQEGGEIEERGEEGGGSDKSLVVKRGDHGGREGRERRGGEFNPLPDEGSILGIV